MRTTKATIARWLNQAKKDGATHLIVVCDTFDHEDYPVSVMPGKDVREVYAKYNGKNMQRVMEVYSLSMDLDAQLNEFRALHFE